MIEPSRALEDGSNTYRDRQRPFLFDGLAPLSARSPRDLPVQVRFRVNTHQKLLGLYLLATMIIATLVSFSIGYAPYAALGKCSFTYVDKPFSIDVLQRVAD